MLVEGAALLLVKLGLVLASFKENNRSATSTPGREGPVNQEYTR